MNVFEAIKDNVTTRQAAEMYGIRVNRHGMAVCPFHNDRNPSMKVDMRFHCFACQADGDAVDFVSRLFGLPSKEAAMKLADDFGICYDSRQKPSVRPRALRILSPLSAGRKKPIKCRMKPIRQTDLGNACSAVLPIQWTFCPLTEAATVGSCPSWYTPKMPWFTFWKMKLHPERSLTLCGQKPCSSIIISL